jgi:hypothetical protein
MNRRDLLAGIAGSIALAPGLSALQQPASNFRLIDVTAKAESDFSTTMALTEKAPS